MDTTVNYCKPLCPPSGCGKGWARINLLAEESAISSEFNDPVDDMFMYNIRDYFAASTEYGHLTSDIYNHWDEISFDLPMVLAYQQLYAAGFRNSSLELMYPSGNAEQQIYIDANTFQILSDIIEYHLGITTKADFIDFLNEVKIHLNNLSGKTLPEIRIEIYGCAQPGWC